MGRKRTGRGKSARKENGKIVNRVLSASHLLSGRLLPRLSLIYINYKSYREMGRKNKAEYVVLAQFFAESVSVVAIRDLRLSSSLRHASFTLHQRNDRILLRQQLDDVLGSHWDHWTVGQGEEVRREIPSQTASFPLRSFQAPKPWTWPWA